MIHLNKNIVLTGMMGSGKTTIGKLLSEKLGMNFIDMDEYIEKFSGSTIKDIFKKGEDYFRTLESKAALKLSITNSTVISTGGGIIKKSSNIELLKKNGIIYFIDRPVDNIAADIEVSKRPLLSDDKDRLFEIFNDRYDQYIRYCDVIIKNDKDIQTAADLIIENYTSICRGGEQ
jgi:shikimate kinase